MLDILDNASDVLLGPITEMEDGSIEIQMPQDEVAEEGGFYENLAETLSDDVLNELSGDLEEAIAKDREARSKRDKQYEDGLRRTGMGDDAPGGATFQGASKVVHPVMAEGCIDFASRAIKELIPPQGPVKTRINASADIQTLERAKRKRNFLNWQLANQIIEYRPEKERLLTQLPLGGSQYEKYWYDEAMGRIRMEFVPVDKVFLPFAASSFDSAQRATQEQNITRQEFETRIRTGFYRDIVNLEITDDLPEETAAEKANDKIEGIDDSGYYDEDGLRTVYEIALWRDFEGEGLRPYVVSMDDATGEILAIYRNWDENDERATKEDYWVENVFIPWRGAYGVGLPHLIGGISAALTGGIRALLDSAHINNAPTMLKLKSGRVVGQNTTVDITQVTEIEGPAGISSIKDIAMPMPFNPPSNVLFQLVQYLEQTAKGMISTSEDKLADVGDRTPVGTTMALIEQGSPIYSSIHARLHESQRKALKIICRLNYKYPDEEAFARFGVTREDFADNDDIEPVSDPNIFSEAQRYAQLQETYKVRQLFPQLKWNDEELARRALELLRVDGSDAILQKTPEPQKIDIVTENEHLTKGEPVKAFEDQDHVAHMTGHLMFALSPIGQMFGPMPLLNGAVGHAKEHLMMYYQQHANAASKAAEAMQMAQGDEAQARTSQMMFQSMLQELQPVLQMIQQAQQMIPPPQPQLDPQSQVALQLGQAEIQRKGQMDQAQLQLKQAEMQATQAAEQARLQMEQMIKSSEAQQAAQKQQFEQSMLQLEKQLQARADALQQQTEIIKNEADNRQHQITELLKNHEDNQTMIIVEKLKAAMQQFNNPVEADNGESQVMEASRLMEEVKGMMAQHKENQSAEQMQAILAGLHGIGQHLAKPKRIVRDQNGDALGIE